MQYKHVISGPSEFIVSFQTQIYTYNVLKLKYFTDYI